MTFPEFLSKIYRSDIVQGEATAKSFQNAVLKGFFLCCVDHYVASCVPMMYFTYSNDEYCLYIQLCLSCHS